jgi:hypothetical protein
MKFFDSNEYEIFKSSISENISSLIVDFGWNISKLNFVDC